MEIQSTNKKDPKATIIKIPEQKRAVSSPERRGAERSQARTKIRTIHANLAFSTPRNNPTGPPKLPNKAMDAMAPIKADSEGFFTQRIRISTISST